MVILERPRPADAVNQMPNKKNGIIVYLEDRIHARRQEIKGLRGELQMFGTLEANHLMDRNAWIRRTNIVDRMLELNSDQYLDRRKLRPHKRATETKGKSPLKHTPNIDIPSESRPVVIYERRKHKKSNNANLRVGKITEMQRQLMSLNKQKETGEISGKEYRKLQEPLARELHKIEGPRGRK